MSRFLIGVGSLVVALATVPAAADVVHLVTGDTVEVDRWRIDGEIFVYENADGSVRLPRSVVARIEPSEVTPASTTTSKPPENEPSGSIRVTREVADLMHQARAALDGREFQRAADLFSAALQDGPDELQPARVGYALAQLALDEDALALGAVLDGLARDPVHPELLELLGDLRDREERVEDALGAWRQAQAALNGRPLARLDSKVARATRELAVGRDYALSASSHFTLRHDGDVDRALTRSVLDHLEQAYWRVSRELDHTPRQPITVLLYPEREFRDVTGAEAWVGGIYDGKIRVPLGGLTRLGEPARRVLTHELAHAVLHAKTRGNCPRWLHEGIAQRSEGRRLDARGRRAIETSLASGWERSREFSYPTSLALTVFLVEYWGETALLRLLDRLGEGAEFEAALRETYGEDEASLARRWAAAFREVDGR